MNVVSEGVTTLTATYSGFTASVSVDVSASSSTTPSQDIKPTTPSTTTGQETPRAPTHDTNNDSECKGAGSSSGGEGCDAGLAGMFLAVLCGYCLAEKLILR